MKQRILSAALALCLCLSTPSAAYAFPDGALTEEPIFSEESINEPISQMALYSSRTVPTPTEIYTAMTALKEDVKYQEGTPWTNDTPYSDSNGYYHWKGGTLDGVNIVAVGCVAFAFILSDAAFGDLRARMYAPGQFSYEDIKVGDILRVSNDAHTVIVLEVNSAGVIVAEGNYNGTVHWGRAISKEEVMRNTSHYITRYPENYVSPDDPNANDSIASETLDGGLAWNLTKAGTLTISGSGAMPDFGSAGEQPWNGYSSQIRNVILEDGVTHIGSCAFSNCGVFSAEISSSVTTIGDSAFQGSSIISASIPPGVKIIGDSAFQNCQNLSSVTFSEGLETIGQNAFRSCTSLTSINLPASIGEVGAGAFFECTKITSAAFAPGSRQVTLGDNIFMQCYYLMSVTLPANIDRIGSGMFQNCLMLTGVEIPQGAESIGDSAFASCSRLTAVIIPASVTTIGTAAFSASSLTDVYFSGTEAQWKSVGKMGDTRTLLENVTIHYNYISRKSVNLKPGTEVTLKNNSLTYGEMLAKLAFNSAEFVDADGNPVAGTLAWKNKGQTVPDAGTTGAEWIFTPNDNIQYAPAEGTTAITVNKAVPYIAVLPTAAEITYGNTLAASALSGGTVQYGNGAGQPGSGTDSTKIIAGTFAWKEPSAKPAMADSGTTEFAVVFTPSDSKNYEAVEGRIKLTVHKAENAPNPGEPGGNIPGNHQPDDDTSGGNQPGNNDAGQEARPDAGIPFIKGEEGKFGWDVIRANEEVAAEGSSILVNMNGITVVPGNIFDSIKGRDVTITFDMENGIVWSVNGKSITAEQAGDIDFSARIGTNAIPADVIRNAAKEGHSIQLSLSHEGDFGFTAVLSINLGKENARRSTMLYYYNPDAKALELICKERVEADGTARLTFTHASDYLIVVDNRAGSGNESITSGTQAMAPKSGDQEHGSLWWILMASALSVILGIHFRRKR